MAFLPHKYMKGNPPYLWLPASNGGSSATLVKGLVMVFSSGKLVTVSSGVGQDIDEGKHFICMQDATISTDGTLIPVLKADENIEFETTIKSGGATCAVGTRYCIHTDGLTLTDTTTKGCFIPTYVEGATAGDTVRGIFWDEYNELS